jgi:hypothetical protein
LGVQSWEYRVEYRVGEYRVGSRDMGSTELGVQGSEYRFLIYSRQIQI